MIRRRALAWFAFCCALAAPGWAAAATQTLTDDATVPTGTIADDADPVTDTVRDTVDPLRDTVRETVKPVTDPITDTVRDTTQPVAETVDPVTDTVRDTVKPVTDTVRDTVKPVTDTVRDTVEPVTDTVGDVVEPIRDTVGPVTDPDRTATDTVRQRDRRTGQQPGGQPSAERTDGAQDRRSDPRAAHQTVPAAGITRGPGNDGGPRSALAPARTPQPSTSTTDAIVRAAVDASRRFSFPLSVAALVLGFLAVQGRIDARDPKLRPLEDEELMFV